MAVSAKGCASHGLVSQVWVTEGGHNEKEESPEDWTLVHEQARRRPSLAPAWRLTHQHAKGAPPPSSTS